MGVAPTLVPDRHVLGEGGVGRGLELGDMAGAGAGTGAASGEGVVAVRESGVEGETGVDICAAEGGWGAGDVTCFSFRERGARARHVAHSGAHFGSHASKIFSTPRSANMGSGRVSTHSWRAWPYHPSPVGP